MHTFSMHAYFFKLIKKINNFLKFWYISIDKCSKYKNLSALSRNYIFWSRYKGLRRRQIERIVILIKKSILFQSCFLLWKNQNFSTKLVWIDREMSNYKNQSKLFWGYILYARYNELRRLRSERIQIFWIRSRSSLSWLL